MLLLRLMLGSCADPYPGHPPKRANNVVSLARIPIDRRLLNPGCGDHKPSTTQPWQCKSDGRLLIGVGCLHAVQYIIRGDRIIRTSGHRC